MTGMMLQRMDDPDDPAAGQTFAITREGLRDGSLLARTRRLAPPGTEFLSDREIEADLDEKLSRVAPGADVWLFGYGSLMWNPSLHFAEQCPGVVHGWHRRYCLWLLMGRGTPANPGLMLALDRGGSCGGLLLRIRAAEARAELLLAWRRELFTGAYHSRWVQVNGPCGKVSALTFIANRAHPRYAGRLTEAVVAERLAQASGSLGSCASYLSETIAALQGIGLRDPGLERLQRRVGEVAK